MRPRWIGLLVGLVVGSAAGCLIEPDLRAACGDGHHDERFEECDPADPPSFDVECEAGAVPRCDDLCQLSCEVLCGNGDLDPGEQCDRDPDSLSTMPILCSDFEVPGYGDQHYAPGANVFCNDECKWDFSSCSLCGNGQLDDRIVDGSNSVDSERCDGDAVSWGYRYAQCEAWCGEQFADCQVECGDDCLHFEASDELHCCIRPGKPRVSSLPCCCELPAAEQPKPSQNACGGPIFTEMPDPDHCPG